MPTDVAPTTAMNATPNSRVRTQSSFFHPTTPGAFDEFDGRPVLHRPGERVACELARRLPGLSG